MNFTTTSILNRSWGSALCTIKDAARPAKIGRTNYSENYIEIDITPNT